MSSNHVTCEHLKQSNLGDLAYGLRSLCANCSFPRPPVTWIAAAVKARLAPLSSEAAKFLEVRGLSRYGYKFRAKLQLSCWEKNLRDLLQCLRLAADAVIHAVLRCRWRLS